ncbi:MAG: ATP-binding cassette domain-containing protein [Alphaproteobacteria bacterium]
MLKFSNVGLVLKPQNLTILKNLNFQIQPKEFVVILGSNGSGKSSLLKLASGDYSPSEGAITNGSKRLAYFSQDTSCSLFHDLTVLENCCLNKQKINFTPFKISTRKEHDFYSEYLEKFHAHLPKKMHTMVGSLSGGERQSLALALSLKQDPDLLMLDEHTSALDPNTAASIMELTDRAIQERGLTTLMVTHNLQHAVDYGTRILGLKDGEILIDLNKERMKSVSKESLMNLYL